MNPFGPSPERMAGLTERTLAKLLDALDADRDLAGERYEHLRRTLVRFFEWRGAPFPEEHCDETLDRIARRLAEGLEIRNIEGYAYVVARLVFLETLKGPESRRAELEPAGLVAPADGADDTEEDERRLACLDRCLQGLPADVRELIVEYYRGDRRGRIEARRAQAERLGIRSEALANRAQRVRDKLEQCVNRCLGNGSAT
jgi:DNA-directed RNA polymerase specialized sigma24 family protein